jgi:lipoyl(octanoyl) transferase
VSTPNGGLPPSADTSEAGDISSSDDMAESRDSHQASELNYRVAPPGIDSIVVASTKLVHSLAVIEKGGIVFEDWGSLPYLDSLRQQQQYLDQMILGERGETIIFCTHPPVVTRGRATQEEDIFSWNGETVDVSRGGRATYHGPSQMIVYPILDLNNRGRDLNRFIRSLESVTVRTLKEFGISAQGNPTGLLDRLPANVHATGVWIDERKVAAIGIAVRRWISFHGLAINVFNDPTAFEGIRPCGFDPGTPISIEEASGIKPDLSALRQVLERNLLREFKI